MPMPFLCVCKSGGAVDIFNSPQALGFLSKLFKAILPLKWGKEDCIGATESPDYPGGLHSSNQAGLTIAGRTACYRTVFILRPAPGCPPLHGNVLRGNSPAWAQQRELTQPFRSTVRYYWPQKSGGGGYAGQLRMTTCMVSAG